MRLCLQTRIPENFFCSPLSTNFLSSYINTAVFFFFNTSFSLIWKDCFDLGLPITAFAKISGGIWKKSWKAFWNIKLSSFLFFCRKWADTRLDWYIGSDLSYIRYFNTRKKTWLSYISFGTYDLVSLFFFIIHQFSSFFHIIHIFHTLVHSI